MHWIFPFILPWLVASAPISSNPREFGDKLLNRFTAPMVRFVHVIVRKIHHLHSDEVRSLPVRALNLPSYGNWTDEGWRLHVHGNIVHQPDPKEETLSRWARRILLFSKKWHDLQEREQALARNISAELLTLPVDAGLRYSMNLRGSSGQHRRMPLPAVINTGDFDGWLPLGDMDGVQLGNDTAAPIQQVKLEIADAEDAISTGFLVPPDGISIVSDVDDILRESKVWRWKHLLVSTISQDFTPWRNMPGKYSERL